MIPFKEALAIVEQGLVNGDHDWKATNAYAQSTCCCFFRYCYESALTPEAESLLKELNARLLMLNARVEKECAELLKTQKNAPTDISLAQQYQNDAAVKRMLAYLTEACDGDRSTRLPREFRNSIHTAIAKINTRNSYLKKCAAIDVSTPLLETSSKLPPEPGNIFDYRTCTESRVPTFSTRM